MRISHFAALAALGLSACATGAQQASNQTGMSPHAAGGGQSVAANESMSQGGVTWTNAGALSSPNAFPQGFVESPPPGPTTTYTQGQPIWIGGGERETANGLPAGFGDEPPPSGMNVTFGQPGPVAPARTQSAQGPAAGNSAQN